MADYFTDYGVAGVAARVAIQLVKREVKRDVNKGLKPEGYVYAALLRLEGVGVPMVRMALHSLSVQLDLGMTSKDWLSGVLYRDLMGYTFRRCFFDAYKVNRCLTPRITNRGGQTSPLAAGVPLEEEMYNDGQRPTKAPEGDSGDRLDKRDAIKRRSRLSDLAR